MNVRNRKKNKEKVDHSETATGLKRLDLKPLPPRAEKKQKGSNEYEPGSILGNYFYLARKAGGVEPGFFAVEINDDFLKRYEQIFGEEVGDIDTHLLELSFEDEEYHTRIEKLVEELYEKGRKGIVPEGHIKLDLLLFKQDYNEPGIRGVTPDAENLSQTSAVKSSPKYVRKLYRTAYGFARSRSVPDENINAILECIATEVARAYGMQAQEQQLVLGSYLNGQLKIMTACKWDPELETLDGCQEGSRREQDYENYLVRVQKGGHGKPIKIKSPNGKYFISDNTIRGLGECIPLFISQGDGDVFGSHMQNKAKKDDEIYGYDFGHAYRGRNPLLQLSEHPHDASSFTQTRKDKDKDKDKFNKYPDPAYYCLQDDFSFTQTRNDKDKIKNLSVCYDTELGERMAGMFFLYKMTEQHIRDLPILSEESSSEEPLRPCFTKEEQANIEIAINLYMAKYPRFKERYKKTRPECMEKIFYDYHFKFIELAIAENDKAKRAEYLTYANKIAEACDQAVGDVKKMFDIFRMKMQLSPLEIELISNLEKLTSATSLTSQNGQVILSHLRIIPNRKEKVSWRIAMDQYLNLYLEASIAGRAGGNAYQILFEYLSKNNKRDDIELIYQGNKIQIILPTEPAQMNAAMEHLAEILNEKNIIKFKEEKKLIKTELLQQHPEHLKLLESGRREEVAKHKDLDEKKEELEEDSEEEEKEKEESIHAEKIYSYSTGTFFSHRKEKSISESESSNEYRDVSVFFTPREVSNIIQPLLSYITKPQALNTAKKFVDKGLGMHDLKISATKECVSKILKSSMTHAEIYGHLAELERTNSSINGDKANHLKKAIGLSVACVEDILKKNSERNRLKTLGTRMGASGV